MPPWPSGVQEAVSALSVAASQALTPPYSFPLLSKQQRRRQCSGPAEDEELEGLSLSSTPSSCSGECNNDARNRTTCSCRPCRTEADACGLQFALGAFATRGFQCLVLVCIHNFR